MLSLYNIWTVARFEIKTLLRSWFFRIFCALVLIALAFLNVVLFTGANKETPWMFRGIPSSISYFNMLLLNIAQTVMAIFLATDFLKRDKADTTETIYMRSMTNGDYVFGKLTGLGLVFIAVNAAVLIISAVIQVVFSDVPFSLSPHLSYFVIISLPTLIFIFGLAVLIMSLVRNQAVTFILLLGLVAVDMVIVRNRFFSAFDITGFFLPLAYSDFIGFSQTPLLLMQRCAFLCSGLGFVFITILMFRRLPQSQALRILSTVLAVLFLLLGPALTALYYQRAGAGPARREQARQLNEQYAGPAASVTACSLDLEHRGERIAVAADLTIANRGNKDLPKLIFSLNPGLAVRQVLLNDQTVPFERRLHLLIVTPPQPMTAGESARLSIRYEGVIDETVTYLQTPEEERARLNSVMLYKADKRAAFITPNFVLLTPECLWYPIAGVTEGRSLLIGRAKSFAEFKLRVRTDPKLQVISQGRGERKDGAVVFEPESAMPQLSLVIGPYRERSLTVDDVTFHLYTHPNHRYYEPYVSLLGDTLHTIIRDLKNGYEKRLGLSYPFSDLSIVEVPIHFVSYNSPLRDADEFVQPMKIMLPENAVTIMSADFRGEIYRFANRPFAQNQTISEKEQQFGVLNRFFESTFLYVMPGRPFGPTVPTRLYSVFPNFYTFVNRVADDRWPLLDAAMEYFLRRKAELQSGGFMRFRAGLTDDEKANLLLRDRSLDELLQAPKDIALAGNAFKSKSVDLFRRMQAQAGIERLEAFLHEGLARWKNQVWPSEDWAQGLRSLGVDFGAVYDQWRSQNTIPGYVFSNVECYSIVQGDRTQYQVMFIVTNTSDVDGIIVTDLQVRGQGGPGFGGGFGGFSMRFMLAASDYQRLTRVAAGESKLVAQIADEEPRSLTINTGVSRNLPMELVYRFGDLKQVNTAPMSGEFPAARPMRSLPNEVVVDNEEPGFRVLSEQKRTPLQELLKIKAEEEEEYRPMRPWQIPDQWVKTVNSDFYGDLVLSAHFIRAGDGSKKVVWEGELPESGNYTVMVHIPRMMMRGMRRGGDLIKDFHFVVKHDDGSESIQVDAASADGWTNLGSFYFSAGKAQVELSDESNGRIVFADAVKWVKR